MAKYQSALAMRLQPCTAAASHALRPGEHATIPALCGTPRSTWEPALIGHACRQHVCCMPWKVDTQTACLFCKITAELKAQKAEYCPLGPMWRHQNRNKVLPQASMVEGNGLRGMGHLQNCMQQTWTGPMAGACTRCGCMQPLKCIYTAPALQCMEHQGSTRSASSSQQRGCSGALVLESAR